MPVPSTLADISATAASNSPAGSDAIGTSLDDYLRAIQAILKRVTTGADAMTTPALGTPLSGVATNLTGTAAGLTAGYANAGPSGSAFSFRNKIINGDMRIAQRGNLALSGTAAYGKCDRWRGTLTGTGVSGTLTQDNISGFSSSKAAHFSSVSFTTGTVFLDQRVESANSYSLTYSGSSVQIAVKARIRHDYGSSTNFYLRVGKPTSGSVDDWTSGATTVATSAAIAVANLTTTVATATFTVATGDFNNGLTLQIYHDNTTVASKNVWIGDVQLEEGSVATPFETRPYGTELALCQRYYYRKISGASVAFDCGIAISTTQAYVITNFPVPMRTSPSVLDVTGTAGDYRIRHAATATACSIVPSLAAGQVANATTLFTIGSAMSAAGIATFGEAVNSGTYLGWSAEL